MNDYRDCEECGERISPASKYGPHISAHRRTEKAEYRYFNGDTKHPYELKACLNPDCDVVDWIQKRRDFCSRRCSRLGGFNPAWKGDKAKPSSARLRAHKLYEIEGSCNRCDEPAKHRHHKDRDTYNNTPENIEMLCASCHGKEHAHDKNPLKGSQHARAKLQEGDVLEIRKRYEQGEGPKAIAEDYPVTPSVISNIVARRIWTHV